MGVILIPFDLRLLYLQSDLDIAFIDVECDLWAGADLFQKKFIQVT